VFVLLLVVVFVSWPSSTAVVVPEALPVPVDVAVPGADAPGGDTPDGADPGTASPEGGGEVPTETPAVKPDPEPAAPKPGPRTGPKPKPTPVPKPVPVAPVAPAPVPEAAPVKPEPAPVPVPKPGKPGKPEPTPKPGKAAPKPDPAPKAQPTADGAARVTIRSKAGGTVNGCSGNKVEFVGTRAFTIDAYLLPATCLVTIDGARGVFQVYGSGEVNCEKQGSAVVCDKQQVP
jgi:outer membrane biosynthesis protein TonB